MLKAAGGDDHIGWTDAAARYNLGIGNVIPGVFTWRLIRAAINDDDNAEDVIALVDHHTPVWTPADVIRYADAVRRGIDGA